MGLIGSHKLVDGLNRFLLDLPDLTFFGQVPQISWLENASGDWLWYCIWAGSMDRPSWKRGAVEIWEIASEGDFSVTHKVLSPALSAGQHRGGPDWWAIPGHRLTDEITSMGIVKKRWNLCVGQNL
jgi:hypothetical protein